MAITASQLVAKVAVEGDSDAKAKLKAVGDTQETTSQKMNTGFLASVKNTAGGLLDFGAKIGGAIIGVKGIADAAIGLGSALISPNAEMEQVRVSFAAFIPDAKQLTATLADLQKFAATTPFESGEVNQAALSLLNMNVQAKDVTTWIGNLGAAVAKVGGNGLVLDDVAAIISQMGVKGKVTTEEMMQLSERNIPAFKILADAMGVPVATLQDMISKGQLGQDKIELLVKSMGKFGGSAMVAQGQTFNGLLSTVADNAKLALAAFSGPLFEQAKTGLTQLGNAVSSPGFQSFASGAGKAIGDVFTSIGQFFSKIDPGALQSLTTSFSQLGTTLSTDLAPIVGPIALALQNMFSSSAASNASQFSGAISGLAGIISGINGVIQTMGGIWNGVILPVLQAVGGFLVSTFAPVWAQLVQVWQTQLLPALTQLWASLQPLMPVFQTIGVIIGGVVVAALVLLVGAIAGVVQGIAGLLSGLAVAVGGIVQIFSGIVQIVSGSMTLLLDLVTGNFGKLGTDLGTIWQGIVTMFTGVWNVIVGVFQGAIGLVGGFIMGFITTVVNLFTGLYNTLVGHSIIPDMVNGIIQWFQGLPAKVVAFITSLVTSGLALFLNLQNMAVSYISLMVTNILTNLTNLKNQAVQKASDIVSGIKGFFTALPGQASQWMTDFGNNLVSGLKAMIQKVKDAAASVASSITSVLHNTEPSEGPMKGNTQWMLHFGDNLVSGLNASVGKVHAASLALAGSIAQPLGSVGLGSAGGSVLPAGTSAIPASVTNSAPTIVVNVPPPTVEMDGQRLSSVLTPYLIDRWRSGTGTRS